MSEETLAEVVASQRATDPRLEQAPSDPEPTPAPEPTPDPEPEPVAAEGADPEPEPTAEPEPKKKRTAEEVLKGRVGHLTKTLSTKDAELAEFRRRAEAAEALLNARPATPGADPETPAPPTPAPASINPATGRTYTQAEFDEAVSQRAQADAFNKQADTLYDAGVKKFPDWKESVDMLNATGMMNPTLIEAALATDAGADVIHHLGADLDEATRILALAPVRMAAELTKLATRLTAPTKVAVSSAPAPIRSVTGAVTPSVDLSRIAQDEGQSVNSYREARAKQGARWAQPRGSRAG